jgi:hypothetical protein
MSPKFEELERFAISGGFRILVQLAAGSPPGKVSMVSVKLGSRDGCRRFGNVLHSWHEKRLPRDWCILDRRLTLLILSGGNIP